MRLISFCIPTYHRGETIQATLESIYRQYDDSFEVIIYDSGQDDLTKTIVCKFVNLYPNIRYIRSGVRGGIDRDIENTLAFASGEYSWLLSSDDAIVDGAVKSLKEELREGHAVYLCNRIVCNHELAPIRNRSWLYDRTQTIFHFKNREDLVGYLNSGRELGAIFSYMSSLIIKNSIWQAAPENSHNYGSYYAHIIKIFGILLNGGSLKYLNNPLVLNRSFNDSFLENGIVNRYLIDFRGIRKIANIVFPKDIELQTLMVRLMILEHPWYQLAKVMDDANDLDVWEEIKKGLREFGYSDKKIFIIEHLGKHKRVVRAAVKIRTAFNKSAMRQSLFSLVHGKHG